MSGMTSSFVESENEKPVVYHYLLTQYEISDDSKAASEEAHERILKRERILERAAGCEAAQEKRRAAHKKKTPKKKRE